MKPRVFIGSSLEGKTIADVLQVNLDHDAWCTVWTQAFPLSANTIDTLLAQCARNDFAIFVYSNDDIATTRNQTYSVPRDNVIFESGFFMGMHGKERAFIVMPRGASDLHIPTDLLGLTVADYDSQRVKTQPTAALGAATTKIRQAIAASSWASQVLNIKTRSSLQETATFPLKLNFTVLNPTATPVAFESLAFELEPTLPLDPRARSIPGNSKYRLQILTGKTPEGKDIYVDRCVIEPGKSVIAWVPIDPALGQDRLDATIGAVATGTWEYRCCWFGERITVKEYLDRL
jgi:hypothetical protein